jgi:hypothetical protein
LPKLFSYFEYKFAAIKPFEMYMTEFSEATTIFSSSHDWEGKRQRPERIFRGSRPQSTACLQLQQRPQPTGQDRQRERYGTENHRRRPRDRQSAPLRDNSIGHLAVLLIPQRSIQLGSFYPERKGDDQRPPLKLGPPHPQEKFGDL